MRVEIDQSGQISRFNADTVFAFSNGVTYSIVIPANVKRQAYERLKAHYHKARKPYLMLFSAGVFILIRDHLHQIERMLIDEEFTGQEATIRGHLLNHIHTIEPHFTRDRIVFWRIGKKSAAHHLALAVYRARRDRRGSTKPDKVVTLSELLEVLRVK